MMKKYTILLFVIFSAMFLTGLGFTKKRVELLNDKKLIDLDAAIGICIPGADAAQASDNVVNQSDAENEEHNEENMTAEIALDDKERIDEEKQVRVIKIRAREIVYETVETDIDELKNKIKQDNGKNVTFKLVDDFAEAHVYKEVKSMLSELEQEIGLKYSND